MTIWIAIISIVVYSLIAGFIYEIMKDNPERIIDDWISPDVLAVFWLPIFIIATIAWILYFPAWIGRKIAERIDK